MQFSEYRVEANKTAIYPERKKIIYPALGLAGEAGEVLNQVKKIFRDDNGTPSPTRIENIISEAGGVYWYVAALANDVGIGEIPEVIHAKEDSLEAVALLLAADAGGIASTIYAFSVGVTTKEELTSLYTLDEELAYVLKRLEEVLYHVGSTPAECMQMNLHKLADRSLRGTLQGDGDNR